jgi:excisionase family DNA binding protein
VLEEKWYTVEQIATLIQVHAQTVRRWLRDGDLTGRNFGGKTGWRVRESVLKDFLDQDPKGKVAA